jgi:TPP-dependent pyruvate/acetoin dehydrogenase alpha subunit
MLRAMMLIRVFEDALLRLPKPGFQLLSTGEEAVAVGVCAALGPDDQLLSSGRSIGPALARGLDPGSVMAEIQGKATGPCKGKGGRGHLARPDAGFFGAHAVVGGNLSVAAGVALSARMNRRRSAVVCLFGDGACGAGALHETLNIATLWKLPLVLVCNNNQYSVSTPAREALAVERVADLARPFGIPGETVDGMDAMRVRDAMLAVSTRARGGDGPALVECLSYRFSPHSTSTRETRMPGEIEGWRQRCPIRLLSESLLAGATIDASTLELIRADVDRTVAEAVRSADLAPYPEPSEGLTDVD